MAGILFQVTGVLGKCETKPGKDGKTFYHSADLVFMGGTERLNLEAEHMATIRPGMNVKVNGEVVKRFDRLNFDVKAITEVK